MSGTTPSLLTLPRLGFIPMTPFMEAGEIRDPEVSVPMLAIVRNAFVEMAEPLLEPETGKVSP
jgi:hypothetical protein